MRVKRHLRSLPAPTSVLVIATGASAPSSGGRVMGGFALPVAALWDGRRLPAGDYAFVASPTSAWVYVQGKDDAAVFFAASLASASRPSGSLLRLVHDAAGYRVSSLRLRDAGTMLLFDAGRLERAPQDQQPRSEPLPARLKLSAGRREQTWNLDRENR